MSGSGPPPWTIPMVLVQWLVLISETQLGTLMRVG